MGEIQKAVAQFRQMQKLMNGGCSDGYCVIEKTKGMPCAFCMTPNILPEPNHFDRIACALESIADALEDSTNDQ
jgi:hypothetical protein